MRLLFSCSKQLPLAVIGNIAMFKPNARGGVTLLAACGAFFVTSSSSFADHKEGHVLPEVTVDAPRVARSKPARKPKARAATARRSSRSAASTPANPPRVVVTGGSVTPAAALAGLTQSPTGQTTTTVGHDQFDNRPSFSVSDVLRDSPGISVKQGNGPRDFGISIRGSNARNGFGIRNMVIFDDGFPVTQPDGLSRSDLIDPHAYGAIDVIRGPSSALYGNYATGGALNFRTRPGGSINGAEYGIDGGSFGYLNNYFTVGKKVGNFEASLFASDARGDGFTGNSWFNTQTVNFLGTYQATPDDRFTLKIINNTVDARLPLRLSLNQFYQNPFQQGCSAVVGGIAPPGCATVSLFDNGFNGHRTPQTAEQAGLNRDDRRTIVGARWEHDFDNQTTWRNQLVFDDRNINQPTGATSAIGDYPSYNFMSDLTHRGQLFGFDSTTYFGGFYNTLSWSGDTRNVMPGGNATLGLLSSNVTGTHTNFGLRAREELKLTDALTSVAGIGWENTQLKGVNTAYKYPVIDDPAATITPTSVDKQFTNIAPELALLYKFNNEWQGRARVGTGYGTPQVGNLFVLPDGTSGNNTQLVPQRNVGYDLGVDWTPNKTVKVSLTGFYEFFRNELVSQATPIANISYMFNAPRSEHRGIELAADWRFRPGWRATLAYTYLDEIYTDYTEIIRGAATGFNRAGNKIPGISPNELTARLGYDEMAGVYAGLGAFVEFQWKDAFYMDNANLLKAPGYELVNLNVHYTTDLKSDAFKTLNVYFEVRNLFDKTYIASANNVANTITGGVQSPASVLANSSSIYAGSPRAFIAGMKVAFR
jgi:iron complex outermembrane receptor protein